ncbi:hypothetical protein L1887_62898 [Cichorium endivia]|nr:hypothetical protein L1887_62898 [Cichorium endivia]
MRLRRKSLQPKSAEEPSDVPALLIECQHVAVLSRKTGHSGEPPGGVVRSGFSTPRQNGSETNKKVRGRTHEGLPVIYWRKVGMTSSPHGLYGLGHTRATMAITMGSKAVRRSESGKIASVRIVLCNSGT